ncbi:TetR family transcriptional regulator [Gordonia sp. PKS22-38]|uniref:TetR family transcriptional regulator n=1 Tax=Gordonia prachuapensis TaxID=3115651 RepID=A0ABU7MS33_9ACTN|nr:TetR family transcriptional regulator [Gordonia sp. PKS22-38]
MSNSRVDVLRAARDILAEHSLADLSMRRLAADLGVRPNALYWHFPNKQTLLAALSDDILEQIPDAPTHLRWDDRLAHLARGLRAALLEVPDSAEVVSSSWASGLSAKTIVTQLAAAARDGGLSDRDAHAVATAVCQLAIGLTIEEQTRAQMERLQVTGPSGRDFGGEFGDGLGVILDGARLRADRSAVTSADVESSAEVKRT